MEGSKTPALVPKDSSLGPFLGRLPGELRNEIYELVLTAPEGLCYSFRHPRTEPRVGRNGPADQSDQLVGYNQLKNVNRRLRYEASGLELKYNTITANARPRQGPGPSVRFLRLLGLPYWKDNTQHLRRLVMTYKPQKYFHPSPWLNDIGRDVLDLRHFCLQNPHCHVTYMLPDFSVHIEFHKHIENAPEQYRWLVKGTTYSWMFRSRELFHLIPMFFSGVRWDPVWAACRTKSLYSGVRLCKAEQFDMANLRLHLGDVSSVPGEMAENEHVRGWIENGV